MNRTLGAICIATVSSFANTASAADDEINVFFNTCMASIKDFSKLGEFAAPLGFESANGQGWIRTSDGLGINIKEAKDRYVCMLLRTGNHTDRLSSDLEKLLSERYSGAFEKKSFQGRALFLVRAMEENVLVEVVPPAGASSIVVVNVRKK